MSDGSGEPKFLKVTAITFYLTTVFSYLQYTRWYFVALLVQTLDFEYLAGTSFNRYKLGTCSIPLIGQHCILRQKLTDNFSTQFREYDPISKLLNFHQLRVVNCSSFAEDGTLSSEYKIDMQIPSFGGNTISNQISNYQFFFWKSVPLDWICVGGVRLDAYIE